MKFVENKQALDVINRMLEDVDNWLTKWLFKYSAQCRLNDKHLEIIKDTFYKHKLRREMLKLDKANYTYKELLDSAQACLLKLYPNLLNIVDDFWSSVECIYEAKLGDYVIAGELNSTKSNDTTYITKSLELNEYDKIVCTVKDRMGNVLFSNIGCTVTWVNNAGNCCGLQFRTNCGITVDVSGADYDNVIIHKFITTD